MLRGDFLKKLLGATVASRLPIQETEQFRKIYLLQCFIAGFSYYEGPKILNQMKEGDLLSLVREPENEYDDCAIALHWNDKKIGFIPADTNEMLSYLLDADALTLFGTITHLEKQAKSWENVAIAIYFLQNVNKDLPAHSNYLTRIEAPHYRTIGKQKQKSKNVLDADDLFDTTDRVIDLDKLKETDEKAYTYFLQFPPIKMKKQGNFVHVNNDGIYTYLNDIGETINVVKDEKGDTYLEFFINA